MGIQSANTMTWEEAILNARKQEKFRQLIHDAYLDADLVKNVEHFMASEEFNETNRLIKKYLGSGFVKNTTTLLDIGAGNGVASLAFARSGYVVSAVEPDPSDTVGHKAIEKLTQHYNLSTLRVFTNTGEGLPFDNNTFDVVYIRQAMHHAADLKKFISEAVRVTKPGGIVFTSRDHVVNNSEQKATFFTEHPLHHMYQGENAFTLAQYRNAFVEAGARIQLELGPLDSVVNYSPKTTKQLHDDVRAVFSSKAGVKIPALPFLDTLLLRLYKLKTNNLYEQAGRLYSFVAHKP